MAAGGFKTFTTGEVLTSADTNNFLMQGVLVFDNATARDAAITAPVEGQVVYLKDTNQVSSYDGSTYVAVGGGSPLTTKGDLYTFSTVDARLPVGADGTILVADSSTPTGLAFAAPAPNFVGCALQKATQTIANNTQTALTWNAETNDSNAFHDDVTNNSRVTIPAGLAGRYLLSATLCFDQSNGVGARRITFYKNGVDFSTTAAGLAVGGVPSATFVLNYTDIVKLAVSDYLEVFALQISGGNLGVLGNASGVGISNWNVIYLGA